jgi:predicted dehydrogenase
MIEAGIVGLGWWSERLIEAVQGGRSARIRFVHGASPSLEKRRPLAERHGLRLSATIEEVVGDPRVQAVVLATPHSLHADQIVAVATAGKPVFCEKPLALTRADAVRAVRACERAGVVLGLGYNRRFAPTTAVLRGIVAAGELGQVLHVEGHLSNENSSTAFAAWRAEEAESPAGGLTGTGIHLLDTFVDVVGPLRAVRARLVRRKPPPDPRDSLLVMVAFANGASGLLAMVRTTPRFHRVHVFGDMRSAEAVGETELVLRAAGGAAERRSFAPVDGLRAELEAFAEAVVGGAPYPIPHREMIDTVAAFEAVVRSVASGREEPVESG